METHPARYQDLLIHEYDVRINRNPSYSLRAFARDLGISVSNLSRIFNGQQDLSLRKAPQVAQVLGLNAGETQYFLALIRARQARSEIRREQAVARLQTEEMTGTELSLEYFRMIADWHYFAILELTQVKDFKSDAQWIATRLGLTVETVRVAIEKLLKLELLDVDGQGNWTKSYEFRATPSGIPSRSIKSRHQQILKKAESALFNLPLGETDFSSTTFTMDSQDMAWAREELKKFRRSLTRRLARKKQKDRLYELSIQLFPLDQTEKEKK